jgi:SAM-dependent methyltransferase
MSPEKASTRQLEKIKRNDTAGYNRFARISQWAQTDADFLAELTTFEQSSLCHHLLAPLPIHTTSRVLEIGGGKGLPSNVINKKTNYTYLIDRNEDEVCGLKAARRVAQLTARPLFIAAGDFETMPFQDGFFDVVLAKSCLHHATDPARAINEIVRVLRTGGLLVAIESCRGRWISEDVALRHFWSMPGEDRSLMNEHAPNIDEWRCYLQNAGFGNLHEEPSYFLYAEDALRRSKVLKYLAPLARLMGIAGGGLYLHIAQYLGQPPLCPHQYTRKLSGFEYFETIFQARKKR